MNDAAASERPYRFIGKPLPRKEDERLITGKGRFTDDFNLDGQAYAAMVRSPHPHARITAIDTAAAKNMSGVLGIFTGARDPRLGLTQTCQHLLRVVADGRDDAHPGDDHAFHLGLIRKDSTLSLILAETREWF